MGQPNDLLALIQPSMVSKLPATKCVVMHVLVLLACTVNSCINIGGNEKVKIIPLDI